MYRYPLPIIADTIATQTLPSGRTFELKRGRYDAGRFPGDTLTLVSMDVTCDGKLVARIFEGYVYGWGKFHASLSAVRKLGWGFNCHDHNIHDTGPQDSLDAAFKLVCFRADYMMSVRAQRESRAA